MRSLRSGNILHAQNIDTYGNILIKLGLFVRLGRYFLIIELMLGPSGLDFVVNITGFMLYFAFFAQT